MDRTLKKNRSCRSVFLGGWVGPNPSNKDFCSDAAPAREYRKTWRLSHFYGLLHFKKISRAIYFCCVAAALFCFRLPRHPIQIQPQTESDHRCFSLSTLFVAAARKSCDGASGKPLRENTHETCIRQPLLEVVRFLPQSCPLPLYSDGAASEGLFIRPLPMPTA